MYNLHRRECHYNGLVRAGLGYPPNRVVVVNRGAVAGDVDRVYSGGELRHDEGGICFLRQTCQSERGAYWNRVHAQIDDGFWPMQQLQEQGVTPRVKQTAPKEVSARTGDRLQSADDVA